MRHWVRLVGFGWGPRKNKLYSVWLTVGFCVMHCALTDHCMPERGLCRAGWFAAAVPLGGFGREARGGRAGAAALAAAKCWAVGVPVRRHSRIKVACKKPEC